MHAILLDPLKQPLVVAVVRWNIAESLAGQDPLSPGSQHWYPIERAALGEAGLIDSNAGVGSGRRELVSQCRDLKGH